MDPNCSQNNKSFLLKSSTTLQLPALFFPIHWLKFCGVQFEFESSICRTATVFRFQISSLREKLAPFHISYFRIYL
ncbi:hypothetical protein Csa_022116 [Cucumis sativus]|uniref:Uncharacterized protein n=1 Tax=Cucumis sativus TaxID=3659 RepID=A0A0A0LRV1_CUCSA|nr:hypothetical protein Csa_022116 [Cucumis sativus]